MASGRKKRAPRPRGRNKTVETPKKGTKSNDDLSDVPTRRSYVAYGLLLTIFTIFNFMYIASNLVLTLISFIGMLYAMNRLVYVYVLRKRLSGDTPIKKSRY